MRCFVHQDRDAIGSCKACSRGLCPECATTLPYGLACRNSHEDLVKLAYESLTRAAQIQSSYSRVRYLGAAVFAILGVIMAALGASSGEPTMPFYLGSGALLAVAVTMFVAQRRAYGKTQAPGKPDA